MLNTQIFVKLFNKLTPLPDGELRDEIETLASQVGFNVRAISAMDASKRSTKLNAFFSGLGKTREVVLFDTLSIPTHFTSCFTTPTHSRTPASHRRELTKSHP